MNRRSGFRAVIAMAACVLGLAGILKLAVIATDPAWRAGVFIPPALLPFLACAEVGVAAVLGRAACGRAGMVSPGATWLLVTATFGIFGMCACGLVITGQTVCDCFGGWATSPGIALTIDTLFLAALVVTRPVSVRDAVRQAVACLATWPAAGLGTWGGIATSLLLGSVALGEPRFLDVLRGRSGDAVHVAGDPIDIGVIAPGSVRVVEVTVENRSGTTVEIVGATAACTCTSMTPASSFPLAIAPYGRVTLPVRVRFPAAAGPFRSEFTYFLRHPRQYRVIGRIGAIVMVPAAASADTGGVVPDNRNQESDHGGERVQDGRSSSPDAGDKPGV